MKFLFIHQNFPGQYRHLAPALAARGHQVAALGEAANVERQRSLISGVELFGYRMPKEEASEPHALFRHFHGQMRRAAVAAKAAAQIRSRGFVPDVIGAHIGWGEAIYLKEVFPESRMLLFCEYYYQPKGGDVGFDPQLGSSPGAYQRLRLMNAPLLMAMSVCDAGITATEWQRSRYPDFFQDRIRVIHDGIDTARVK